MSEPVNDIRVVKGSPTDAELAALLTVLAGLRGGPAADDSGDANLWAHPVGKLRYQMGSWQRVTLLERTYLRR